LPTYKLALRKAFILINDDVEQKFNVFKLLKKQKKHVYFFNPCIVNEKIFHPMNKNECANKVGFDKCKTNLLSMSRIPSVEQMKNTKCSNYEKDVFLIIEMFRLLSEKDSKAHLHIVGEGTGLEEAKDRIKKYKLQERVTFHGFINPTNDENDSRPFFINAADLILNAGPLIEFNDVTSIFEAFMCKKPVAAYKRYPCVSTEQKGGFLVDIDPAVGAEQIALRLDQNYLNRKSDECEKIPYSHNVPFGVWGKELFKILIESRVTRCR
jgi:glycosyltransferase involved in cell wall biosynthesis